MAYHQGSKGWNMSESDDKTKFDRSPSYPFISLKKAEERAKQFWEKHRKEGARLPTVAPTWGYALKSSGLQQTVGALKQYGLMEDVGSGEERKVQLTDLGRRVVADQREGAREAALKEAAMRPRLFQEYRRWIGDMPSKSHCLSELELDRGFNPLAASTFLKAFQETISFAGIGKDDTLSPSLKNDEAEEDDVVEAQERPAPKAKTFADASLLDMVMPPPGPSPLSERLKVELTVGQISVSAILRSADEVDTVIAFLQANKVLLGSTPH
jgi:hypothetical protein